jgi:hypothetical protein
VPVSEELAREARHEAVGQGGESRNAEHAGAAGADLLRGCGDAVETGERALHFRVQGRRGGGRHEPRPALLEERDLQRQLQVADQAADRGLRHAHQPGRPGYAARQHHGPERLHLAQIDGRHRHSLHHIVL